MFIYIWTHVSYQTCLFKGEREGKKTVLRSKSVRLYLIDVTRILGSIYDKQFVRYDTFPGRIKHMSEQKNEHRNTSDPLICGIGTHWAHSICVWLAETHLFDQLWRFSLCLSQLAVFSLLAVERHAIRLVVYPRSPVCGTVYHTICLTCTAQVWVITWQRKNNNIDWYSVLNRDWIRLFFFFYFHVSNK